MNKKTVTVLVQFSCIILQGGTKISFTLWLHFNRRGKQGVKGPNDPPPRKFTWDGIFYPRIFLERIIFHQFSKIIKTVATRCQILRLKCTKFDFGCTPRWGRLQRSPRLPSWI